MYKYRFIFLEFNILVIFFDVINLKKKIEMCYLVCDYEEI